VNNVMPRSLMLLYASLLIVMSGVGLTIPAIPFLVARVTGEASPASDVVAFHLGALTSAHAAAQLLLAPVWGRLADRYGRKPLVLAGLAGFALAQSLFSLGTSMPWLYGGRLVAGTFSAALMTASGAYVADQLPREERGRGMAWQGAAISAGFVMGPALSGLLAGADFHVRLSTRHLIFDRVSLPFVAAAALAALLLPAVGIWLPESRAPVDRSGEVRVARPHLPWALLVRRVAGILLLTLLAQAVLGLFEAVLALYGARVLGFGVKEIGYLFAACGGAMVVVQGGALALIGRAMPPRTLVSSGFATAALGLSLLLLSRSLALSLATVSLVGIGLAAVTPTLSAAVANHTGEPQIGAALGLQNAATSFGQMVGPVLGALLFTRLPRLPFGWAASVALAAAFWSWRSMRGSTHGPKPGLEGARR
jgi:DHA1 family multidrug resistance protein-like MFS transporter